MNGLVLTGAIIFIGVVAFSAYTCCVAAGNADRAIEEMETLSKPKEKIKI